MLCLALTACQSDESTLINVPNGGGGGRDPQKPKDHLLPQVMLALSGWAEAYELIELAQKKPGTYGCVVRSADSIEWKRTGCPDAVAGRTGRIDMKSSGTTTLLQSSVAQPMDSWIKIQSQRHIGHHVVDLRLTPIQNQIDKIFFSATLDYDLSKGGGGVHYQFFWELTGEVDRRLEPPQLTSPEGTLIVTRSAPRTPAVQFVFELHNLEPLKWQKCGTVAGKFKFKGHLNDLLTVISDPAQGGLASESGGGKYSWPKCEGSLYALILSQPFWLNPEP